MPTRRSLRTRPRRFGTVGVIMTRANLRFAVRMPALPDLFEIRLDHLTKYLAEVEDAIVKLRAPIIITARHPLEGGANKLDAPQRTALLLQFLGHASYVDIELRALHELRSVHRQARAKKIGLILTFHDLKRTPSLSRLRAKACAAIAAGADIIKVATAPTPTRFCRRATCRSCCKRDGHWQAWRQIPVRAYATRFSFKLRASRPSFVSRTALAPRHSTLDVEC